MKKIGDKAELLSIDYLKRNGYEILDTNFKFSTFGEIDVICKKDGIIIFVEVKYRSNNLFGSPEESITNSKLKKIEKTVYYYCNKKNLDLDFIRFDIIAIEKMQDKFRLTHYKNQGFSK